MVFKPNVGDIFLNKYEIVSLVGEGAFGCVYRARDQKLDRIVAIKFINAVNGVLERFADELEAIKGLDHPNIVRLYDFDILRDGVPCMVMEFVNGREIGDILVQEGTFDTIRICEIALQVVDALVETHNHGIIHCDLKPENIMLTSVGARTDVVKLIDFGVASLLSKSNDTERSRLLVGTPQYMAPEQIKHGELGPWTDIYAMGLILIEMFTGQFVFDAEDPRDVLKMQLYTPVNIPHKLACSELGPIIAKAVEKDIEKRYQSTQQFYDDLKEAYQTIQAMMRQKPQRQHQESIHFRNRPIPTIFEDFNDFSGQPAESANQSSLSQTDIPLLGGVQLPANASDSASAVNQNETADVFDNAKLEDLGLDALSTSLSSSFGLDPVAPAQSEPAKPVDSEGILKPVKSKVATRDALLRVSEADLTVPRSPSMEHLRLDTETSHSSKKSIRVLIACFIVLAVVASGSYLYQQGYLESWGILPSSHDKKHEPVVQNKDNTPAVAAKTNVRYTTIKQTAKTMAVTASHAAAIGVSKEAHQVESWRIFGTPMTAGIYVNNVCVCQQTPCTIHLFGNSASSKLEIRDNRKSSEFSLAGRDNNQPVMVELRK